VRRGERRQADGEQDDRRQETAITVAAYPLKKHLISGTFT
jgi:hypothetical protein